MKTLITVENMRGAVIASDSCNSIFSLGEQYPIVIGLTNNNSYGCDLWRPLFDGFKDYLSNCQISSFPDYPEAFSDYVNAYESAVIIKEDIKEELSFLGFSDDDIFPSFCRCEINLPKDKPFSCDIKEMGRIDLDNKVMLRTSGDCEDVDSILSGIATPLKTQFVDEFSKYAEIVKTKMLDAVKEAGGKAKEQKVIEDVENEFIHFNFLNKLNMYESKEFIDKLHIGVDGFNMEDMIKMCENIIDLAGMQRHFREKQKIMESTKQIAIVTKAEGFVWIKKGTEE